MSTVVFEPLRDGIVTDFLVTGMTGGSVSKDVQVAAEVKRPDGRIVSKHFVITIQNRIITKISEGPGSPSTPPS
jgi:hypothetical protein